MASQKAKRGKKHESSSAPGEPCPYCEETLTEEWIRSAYKRLIARQGGGRPPVLRACPYCGNEFSARDLRIHKPACPRHPRLG